MLQQLRALLWKNWVVRRRHYITLGFEVAIPLLLAGLMYYVMTLTDFDRDTDHRDTIPNFHHNITIYPEPVFDNGDVTYGLSGKTVFVAPDSPAVRRVTEQMNRIFRNRETWASDIVFQFFQSEENLLQNYTGTVQDEKTPDDKLIGALVFSGLGLNFTDLPLHYAIRVIPHGKYAGGLTTDESFSRIPSEMQYTVYGHSRFVAIQYLVNEAYLKLKSEDMGREPLTPTSRLQIRTIPYPAFDAMRIDGVKIFIIPLAFSLGLMVFFATLVKRLVDEKANGSREMLRMMGMSDWTYWFANFVSYFLFVLVVLIAMLLILFFIPWNGYTVFLNDFLSFPIVLIFFSVYCIDIILLAFLISVIFNRPIISVVFASVFWIVSIVPGLVLNPISKPSAHKPRLWCSLLPNSGINFAIGIMSDVKSRGHNINFEHLTTRTMPYGSLTLGAILGQMIATCVILCFLIWYLDNVWPWQSGVPKSPWFLFTRTYWIKSKTSQKSAPVSDPKYFEAVAEDKPVAIELTNVSKSYGISKKKQAVNDLSLRIYRDQLTCLLGHNGAGKTTTMNMVTGMFAPSKGSITINGYDLATQTHAARQSISLCPQHNPLYGELTAKEHLFFYGAIKGFPWSQLRKEVLKTVADVTLVGHESKTPSQLSGGMKRKLCLGIALVGNSQIVILDEPTSGLDTEVRRSIWDLLREARKSRTILMSTHDMEEADALGDRIVIMTSGKVTCAGSTMFLKKVYGAGHNLRIAKLQNFDLPSTQNLVKRYFPRCKVKSDVGSELILNLDDNEKDTDRSVLIQFFKEFERKKSDLGIESYGLSITTMEDVFLRVGELSDPESDDQNKDETVSSDSYLMMDENLIASDRLTGSRLTVQRIVALFYKRINVAKRDLRMFIFMILIPSLLLMATFAWTSYIMDPDDGSHNMPVVLDLGSLYGQSVGFFAGNNLHTTFIDKYRETAAHQKVKLEEDHLGIDPNDFYVKEMQKMSMEKFLTSYIVGLNASEDAVSKTRSFTMWAGNAAYHAPAVTLDLLYKSLDYELTGKLSDITVTNHPLPEKSSNGMDKISLIVRMNAVLMLMIPVTMAFMSSSYVMFPIHERASNSKLIQLMTGMNPLLLHFTNFIFDFCVHIIASLIAVAVILLMDDHHILSANSNVVAAIFLVFLAFGAASIMMAYVAAFFLRKPGTGFAILVLFNLISGSIFSTVAMALRLVNRGSDPFIIKLFDLVPVYDVTSAITKLYKTSATADICRNFDEQQLASLCLLVEPGKPGKPGRAADFAPCCPDLCEDFEGDDVCLHIDRPVRWARYGVGYELLMMFLSFLVGAAIVFLLDSGLLRKIMRFICSPITGAHVSSEPDDSDPDVASEKNRIQNLIAKKEIQSEALVVDRMAKNFGKMLAVRGVTFGVHKQECFGLLGVNGAGKTTTFRMLTGDTAPSTGDAYRDKFSVKNSLDAYRKELGYCPQFDPLLDKLTGRETLYLFARLRGVLETDLKVMVEQLIRMSDLSKHADKRSETYSGGNKRKLSMCIALIANPKVILLDEPTAGVDPAARRKIWTMLSHIRNTRGCSIILTSHSMQECENLCARISIMVAGRFVCMGSTQHLRSRFGKGYTVSIKLKREHQNDAAYEQAVTMAIAEKFPSAILTDKHESMWTYRIPDPKVLWSTIFEVMESVSARLDFEDYIVSDTTLEQIFIGFARNFGGPPVAQRHSMQSNHPVVV